jgi:hypothetical protein
LELAAKYSRWLAVTFNSLKRISHIMFLTKHSESLATMHMQYATGSEVEKNTARCMRQLGMAA